MDMWVAPGSRQRYESLELVKGENYRKFSTPCGDHSQDLPQRVASSWLTPKDDLGTWPLSGLVGLIGSWLTPEDDLGTWPLSGLVELIGSWLAPKILWSGP